MNVSKDTIRRRIKKGELKAEMLPGPYGTTYYIREQDLAEAAEVVNLVSVARQLSPHEIKELMQAVIEPLQAEIVQLRQEVHSLKDEIKLLEAPKQNHVPWYRKIFMFNRGGDNDQE